MKDSLTTNMGVTRRFVIDRDSTIDFMGDAIRVYGTPSLLRDVEITCRDFLLGYVDEGEDSVGVRVELEHMAPTLLNMRVEIEVRVTEIKGPMITFEFTGRDPADQITKGIHIRCIVDIERTAQRLQAKAKKVSETE